MMMSRVPRPISARTAPILSTVRAGAIASLLLFGVGCRDSSDGNDPEVQGDPATAVALFELPATGPVPFLAVPFPNDLYIGEDGTVEIGEMPSATPSVANMRIELNQRRGFCRTCTITFPIDGMLDRASVPGDAAPSDEASINDSAVLLRADGVVTGHADPGDRAASVSRSPRDSGVIERKLSGIKVRRNAGGERGQETGSRPAEASGTRLLVAEFWN